MSQDDRTSVLIPAAGSGERLGRGPKALLSLQGRPLLSWLAEKSRRVGSEVLVAVPEDGYDQFAAACPGCTCIVGGATRQESVARLAGAASGDWLVVQDAARPFASVALMSAVRDAARATGCAGAFLGPEVPVARLEHGRVGAWFEAGEIGIFQAPQAFSRALLLEVLALADCNGWYFQSTLQLALRAGKEVVAVAGEKTNIKITTEEDWIVALQLKEHLQ